MSRKHKKTARWIEFVLVMCLFGILLITMVPKFLKSQSINTEKNFPDPVFKRVIEDYMGVEPGERFTAEEAINKNQPLRIVRSISLAKMYPSLFNNSDPAQYIINSIKGIEYFPNITEFYISHHKITELNLENFNILIALTCSHNNIKYIHFPAMPILQEVNLSHNQLDSIDVAPLPNLMSLNVSNNNLTSLDTSKNSQLQSLKVANNNLTNLILPIDNNGNTPTTVLDCQNNKLKDLNLSTSTPFNVLDISNNFFMEIPLIDWNKINNIKLFNFELNHFTCKQLDDFVTIKIEFDQRYSGAYGSSGNKMTAGCYYHQQRDINLRNCDETTSP